MNRILDGVTAGTVYGIEPEDIKESVDDLNCLIRVSWKKNHTDALVDEMGKSFTFATAAFKEYQANLVTKRECYLITCSWSANRHNWFIYECGTFFLHYNQLRQKLPREWLNRDCWMTLLQSKMLTHTPGVSVSPNM